jgi:group I intron endonuclease
MRKKRSDRNHIIYKIDNTVTGESYIGITQLLGRAYRESIQRRWRQHVSRANTQNLNWRICESIRQYGPEVFIINIFEVVRGKSEVHARETQIIKELKPVLNTTSNK